jgi:hypothetical protein
MKMNTIIGLIMWFSKLVYLLTVSIFGSIIKLFKIVFNQTSSVGERGKTFIRAYAYLYHLEDFGESVEQANHSASEIFTAASRSHHDHQMMIGAANYIKEKTGGKQLPVIAEARSKGFLG